LPSFSPASKLSMNSRSTAALVFLPLITSGCLEASYASVISSKSMMPDLSLSITSKARSTICSRRVFISPRTPKRNSS